MSYNKTLLYFHNNTPIDKFDKFCQYSNLNIIKIDSEKVAKKFKIDTLPSVLLYNPKNSSFKKYIGGKQINNFVRKENRAIFKKLSLNDLNSMEKGNPYIIIPYRDNKEQERSKQLKEFTETISKYHPDWHVIVVEQSDDNRKFNRGALLNVGTKIASEEKATYVIYHDVDLIPEKPIVPYYETFPSSPIHIGKAWTTKYNYDRFLGGILSMSIKDIKKINGFPNHFWGWGGEDDAIRNRIADSKLTVYQPDIKYGIRELPHELTQSKQELKNMTKWEDLKADNIKSGYNNVVFKIIKREQLESNIKKITVELGDMKVGGEHIQSEIKIIKSYNEALDVAKRCISNLKCKNKETGIWRMDIEAAENTLKYIYEKLHHSCYLLCVVDGNIELSKLENNTTAPSFRDALVNKLRNKDHKMIKYIKKNQWRIMQCVAKPYVGRVSTTVEYPKYLNQLRNIPNGIYILNLTDAILLREDGHEPWPMVTGDKMLEDKYNFSTHLPILGCSGAVGYYDVPIPNYDDVRYVLGMDRFGNLETNWDNKKSVAVFRGGATGCGLETDTNMRLKIGTIKSEYLDAGVVVARSNSLRFDPKHGLDFLNSNVKTVPFMSFEEQSKYKYIVHIDGNVGAYRLLKSLLAGSVILKVEGIYRLWADEYLEPNVHYIPIKEDLSNLLEMIEWCRMNDDKCRKMAEASYKVAKKILNLEFINKSFVKILKDVGGY